MHETIKIQDVDGSGWLTHFFIQPPPPQLGEKIKVHCCGAVVNMLVLQSNSVPKTYILVPVESQIPNVALLLWLLVV